MPGQPPRQQVRPSRRSTPVRPVPVGRTPAPYGAPPTNPYGEPDPYAGSPTPTARRHLYGQPPRSPAASGRPTLRRPAGGSVACEQARCAARCGRLPRLAGSVLAGLRASSLRGSLRSFLPRLRRVRSVLARARPPASRPRPGRGGRPCQQLDGRAPESASAALSAAPSSSRARPTIARAWSERAAGPAQRSGVPGGGPAAVAGGRFIRVAGGLGPPAGDVEVGQGRRRPGTGPDGERGPPRRHRSAAAGPRRTPSTRPPRPPGIGTRPTRAESAASPAAEGGRVERRRAAQPDRVAGGGGPARPRWPEPRGVRPRARVRPTEPLDPRQPGRRRGSRHRPAPRPRPGRPPRAHAARRFPTRPGAPRPEHGSARAVTLRPRIAALVDRVAAWSRSSSSPG